MSTSATILDQSATSAVIPVTRSNVTFAVVFESADGKITKKRHTSSVNDINELKGIGKDKDGKDTQVPYTGKEAIAFEQTVVKSKVNTMAGFEELVPDADERINIINKGLDSKFNQLIRGILIETNEADTEFAFTPVEPVYDATPLYAQEAKRTTLNPLDRAMKTILGGNLSADMIASIQAALASLQAAQSGAGQQAAS